MLLGSLFAGLTQGVAIGLGLFALLAATHVTSGYVLQRADIRVIAWLLAAFALFAAAERLCVSVVAGNLTLMDSYNPLALMLLATRTLAGLSIWGLNIWSVFVYRPHAERY